MVKASNPMHELLCAHSTKPSPGLDARTLWPNMSLSVETNVAPKSDRKPLPSEWIGGEWLVTAWGPMRKRR